MSNILTVTKLNEYIGELLRKDKLLRDIWIKGEISGYKLYQSSGHIYLTLKDEETSISCVMFKSRARQLQFKPEDGMEILVRGYVAVFTKQGRYQLYIEEMQPYGIGGLLLYLEQLKERYAAKGYFDQKNKKVIPAIVHRVGVVTSQDGAAFRDIVRVLKNRHRNVEIILVHSSVQGECAPTEIARGIKLLNEYKGVDVIIVGRGGGSFEDLMAFNGEDVVQAIYESEIPVISAVGHEVDYCMADLVADVRAATPTQAAQLAVPEFDLIERQISDFQKRMLQAIMRKIDYNNEILDRIMMKKVWQKTAITGTKQEKLAALLKDLEKYMLVYIREKMAGLSVAAARIDNLDPLKVMKRGYAMVYRDGKVIRDPLDINTGEFLQVILKNIYLDVKVIKKGVISDGID